MSIARTTDRWLGQPSCQLPSRRGIHPSAAESRLTARLTLENVPDQRRDSGLKWLRGSEHFKWLEAAWQAYTPAFQSELVIGPIRDGVELRLGKLSDPPRKEWSIVIGDCLQNFRSALDHMVWQLAPQKARVTTGTTLAFPIFAHPKQ